ncbi:MAG: beta-propeller domain-containing protein [Acutalibacteraceae bacterium]
MKKEHFDDIQKLFNEATPLPEELSKENIVKKIGSVKQQDKKKVHYFPKIAAAIAVVLIAVIGVSASGILIENKKAPDISDTEIEAVPAVNFSDEKELKKYFDAIVETYGYDILYEDANAGSSDGTKTTVAAAPTMAAQESFSAAAVADTQASSTADSSYGKTNTQVDGVDEADIVKNDGRYIYVVSDRNLLTIVDTQTMQTVYSKEIEASSKEYNLEINDIYVNGNLLVAVCELYQNFEDLSGQYDGVCYSYCYAYLAESTENIVFDITDKTNPKQVRTVSQDGNLVSSRMVGNFLYTITRYTPELGKKTTAESYIPEADGQKLSLDSIYVTDKNEDSANYMVVTAFDTTQKNGYVGKASVLGNADDVYCTSSTLYVAGVKWVEKHEREFTQISSFSLDGTNIAYQATGKIPGWIDSQYSFDEKDGYLRVALTDYDYETWDDVSSIYVLDKELKVVGKIVDIAPNEEIKSVRYIGNTAYVVTFRNTDPLFAVDLSDPTNPTVIGKVKLPGFSEYLHPLTDGRLVGIGYSGDDDDADYSSVKISLFDVSDPTNPQELDSFVIKDASTDVCYEPKAFAYWEEKGVFGIPVMNESYDENSGWNNESSFILFEVQNDKIIQKATLAQPEVKDSENETVYFAFNRATYIGDKIYTVTDYNIAEFDFESSKQLRTVQFAEPEVYEDVEEDITYGAVEITESVVID